jgi:hypothetical protein
MRLLWDRLTESSEARLNRIRQIGFLRFCATYAIVFPLCHLLAAGVRVALVGSLAGLDNLPIELIEWTVAGGGVATLFWLAVLLRQRRTEKAGAESR